MISYRINRKDDNPERFTSKEREQIIESILFSESSLRSNRSKESIQKEDGYTVVVKGDTTIKFKELG